MLATRNTIRSLARLPKSCIQRTSKLSATPATVTSRSLYSDAYTNTATPLCPSAGSSTSQRIPSSRLNGSFRIARRDFSATTAVSHGHLDPPKPGEELYVTFIDKDGDEHKIAVSKGDNLLTIAQAHDIEMEGACEGSCACSTCHIIVESEDAFDKIPEATDDENDMLDLAFGLTETSRLGCQIDMTPELNGLRVRLPSNTRNLQAKDFSA
ncbi:Adrenodoxin-like protein, mitochondrial [Lachnellula hyalina]|uniref:Adrenodoxin-like protein, mitochondrial n=1 Tax=Lachnellula hyalina TaxID=1316788 RepID=A0A8H8R613_9HELO|nr:Adrenodoxin-like protein, mitochondrial [Lachnellula hyalina]TVY29099.1 Adrenodoxin-like protein, mitochondrial [Lachnellula hyalina]